MKKTELIAWLAAQPWCGGIAGETLHATHPDGTQWCGVTCHEVDSQNNTMIMRNANFYVTEPGSENESAWWQDAAPQPTLAGNRTPETPVKMISYRTLVDALGMEMATSILAKMEAVAEQTGNIAIREYVKMITTYGVDNGININSPGTQETVRSLAAMGVLTQDEVDAVLSLAD